MVQGCLMKYGTKLQDLILAIEKTGILRYTYFMVMCVLVVKLEYFKIRHLQEQLVYCRKLDDFKCENGGIRMYSKENGLTCWCTPDYSGEYCQTKKPVSFISRTLSLFHLGNSDVSRGKPTMWWSIFPFTSGLQLKTIYTFHQSALKRLENVQGDNNDGHSARILPSACPLECCRRDKSLPPLNTLYDTILIRNPGQFKKDRRNNNLLLDAFYRYFVLQFCGTNSNLTVTASQLYGNDAVSESSMRSFSGGKLKTRKYNYKHYAKNDVFTLRSDVYLKASTNGISTGRSWFSRIIVQKFKRLETLSTNTMLYVVSTVWVREHNRVCDELSQKWPLWTDQNLYATARKIVTGQMMTIMMNEVFDVELRPEVYHDQMKNISFSGTPIELYLTMAVSNLPEKLQKLSSNLTSVSDTIPYLEDGLVDALQFMVNSEMGMIKARNEGDSTEELTKTLMTLSREKCLQGFNSYRRRLGLPAYNSFFDLTGNIETATELESMYSSVENVEFLTGVFAEKSSSGVLPTIKVLTNSYIVNSILTNHLTSKHLWAPDTFGGIEFFDLVKFTNLKSLVFRNVMGMTF